jgi:hypothetical protein
MNMSQITPMPEQLLNALRELIQQGRQRTLRAVEIVQQTFVLAFPNWNALRSELGWTHYRLLSADDATRQIGQQPAAQISAQGEPIDDR